MSKKPVTTGIFLGRGLPKDVGPSFMDWGFSPIDSEGNLVDLDNLPDGTDPLSLKLGGVALLPGKQNYMPFWDETGLKLKGAVESGNFAHPKMQEQIDAWRGEGVYGEKLYLKVKEAKGLLTLKDVGLDSSEQDSTPAPAPEEKTGG